LILLTTTSQGDGRSADIDPNIDEAIASLEHAIRVLKVIHTVGEIDPVGQRARWEIVFTLCGDVYLKAEHEYNSLEFAEVTNRIYVRSHLVSGQPFRKRESARRTKYKRLHR
jgi:hypothetical protein